MTTGNSQQSGRPDITELGHGVFQIDTKMACYQGIAAGYLIRSSRPCLVETGTSTSAPVVRAALASLEDLQQVDGIHWTAGNGSADTVRQRIAARHR